MGPKSAILFFLLALCGHIASGQITTPKYSNEFLAIPAGARAQGMGGAQIAVTEGSEAGFWNPASLLHLQTDHTISLMHTEFFGGVSAYDYLSYASPLDSTSAFGLTLLRLGIDNIPDTRFLYDANGRIQYDMVQLFSAADYAFLVSYARTMARLAGVELGISAKIIHRKVGDFARAWGFGVDVGINYELSGWKFSAVGRDITGTFNAWSHSTDLLEEVYQRTGNTLPDNSIEVTLPQFIFGVSRSIIDRSKFGLLGTMDLRTTYDGRRNTILRSRFISIDPVVGLEGAIQNKIFIRSGLGGFQKVEDKWSASPHFGLGFRISWLGINYAFSRLTGLSEGLFTHSFSLNIQVDE